MVRLTVVDPLLEYEKYQKLVGIGKKVAQATSNNATIDSPCVSQFYW